MDSLDNDVQSVAIESFDFASHDFDMTRKRTLGDEGNEYVVLEAYEFDVEPVRLQRTKAAGKPKPALQAIRRWLT